MYLSENQKLEFKLYYAIGCVDGGIHDKEVLETLNKIADAFIEKECYEDRTELFAMCKEMGTVTYETITQLINKLVNGDNNSSFFSFGRLKNDKQRQAQVIWNMINIGYANKDFCDVQRKVVDYLASQCRFDRILYKDFLDTAETMLALTKKKEWLNTTNKPYNIKSAQSKEVDAKITELQDNIKISIFELKHI